VIKLEESIKIVPETTWAYIAGMVDGEGHLAILRHFKKDNIGVSRRGYEIETVLTIGNMDRSNLEWIQQAIGLGTICLHKNKKRNTSYGEGICLVYTVRFSPNDLRVILPNITPYLVQKKDRAEVLSSFLDFRSTSKENGVSVLDKERKYFAYEQEFDRLTRIHKPWIKDNPKTPRRKHFTVMPEILKTAEQSNHGDKKQ
jgi:hypothetical protein